MELLFIVLGAIVILIGAAVWTNPKDPSTQPDSSKPIVLYTTKKVFSTTEYVEFTLENRSDETYYLSVSPFNEIEIDERGGINASVFQKTSKNKGEAGFEPLNTFDAEASMISTAEYSVEPIPIASGQKIFGRWSGSAFRALLNQQFESFKPKGTFKISIEIQPTTEFVKDRLPLVVESNEFEIK